MIKNNKKKLIVSCVIILLPIVVGLLLWNKLPDTVATHWGADGNADGFSSKAMAVFLMPLFLLATHFLCLFVTSRDPKNKNQTPKAMGIVFWLAPAISLFTAAITYCSAFGFEFSLSRLMPALLGVMFIIIGNYLPKCKQNYTLGIKLPWTLNNEENWNRTHRLGGKVWVCAGIIAVIAVFLPENLLPAVMIPVLLCAILIPTVYSYLLHKKQVKNGDYVEICTPQDKFRSVVQKISLVFVAAVMVFVGAINFAGDIKYTVDTASVAVDASFWPDSVIEFSEIDSIEYREHCNTGSRTNGFGSSKLLMGTFRNEEFGSYTRYSYTKCDAAIVIKADGKVLVLGDKSPEATKELYDSISSHTK